MDGPCSIDLWLIIAYSTRSSAWGRCARREDGMSAKELPRKIAETDARYIATIEQKLSDAERRYCIILLKHSPRHKAAQDALFRHHAGKLFANMHGMRAAHYSGRSPSDLLSFACECLRKAAAHFNLNRELSEFDALLGMAMRNHVFDVVRGDNGLVHKPRRVFQKMKAEGTLVNGEVLSVSDPSVAGQAEMRLSGAGGCDAAGNAFVAIVVRRELGRLLREVPEGTRHRMVLEEHLLGGLSQREVQELMVEAGFPKCTESRLSQLRSDLIYDLGGTRKVEYGRIGRRRK